MKELQFVHIGYCFIGLLSYVEIIGIPKIKGCFLGFEMIF